MPTVRDYNQNWNSLFYYDETSPEGLRRASDVFTGRSLHIKVVEKDSVAGSVDRTKAGQPKAWYVFVSGKRYLVHRIIWVINNGFIDPALVVNHKDNNPLNNQIDNLELTTHKGNARRRIYHREVNYPKNNSTGYNGISVRKVLNGSRTKELFYIIAAFGKLTKSFRFDPAIEGSKEIAIEDAKQWKEKKLNELSKEIHSYVTNVKE